jgi:hypothetical protein
MSAAALPGSADADKSANPAGTATHADDGEWCRSVAASLELASIRRRTRRFVAPATVFFRSSPGELVPGAPPTSWYDMWKDQEHVIN